jgi:hypothetical protein
MEFTLRGEHPVLEILREQLAAATVSSRDYTEPDSWYSSGAVSWIF